MPMLIVTPDASGLPSAQVPFPCMWDLVEYLSYQRRGTYQYRASLFTVTFPRMDSGNRPQILDEWVHAGADELAPA